MRERATGGIETESHQAGRNLRPERGRSHGQGGKRQRSENIGDEHDRPEAQSFDQVTALVEHEHDGIEGVFGEQLLPPDDHWDKADRVDETLVCDSCS